jgi:hypothetical protein
MTQSEPSFAQAALATIERQDVKIRELRRLQRLRRTTPQRPLRDGQTRAVLYVGAPARRLREAGKWPDDEEWGTDSAQQALERGPR